MGARCRFGREVPTLQTVNRPGSYSRPGVWQPLLKRLLKTRRSRLRLGHQRPPVHIEPAIYVHSSFAALSSTLGMN